jgi:hypothetical protein
MWSGLTSCVAADETKRSDVPVTVEQAREGTGIRLPLPESARNVRYLLFGRTQNWRLYLSFQASLHDVEEAIRRELASYSKLNAIAGVFPSEEYRKQSIAGSISSAMERSAPKWWQPGQVANGYFIGSAHPHDHGPHFWVDPATQTVFYYERF